MSSGGSAACVLPTRIEFASGGTHVLKRGRGAKPDVLKFEAANGAIIVKDYSGRAAWVRRWLGPWLVARELRVHAALDEHPAVPRALGRIDEVALALEFRSGEPLTRALAARIGEERAAHFATELGAAIAAMHRLGVVHLDLRHRDNILYGDDGRPVLLDFAAAMCFQPGSFWYRWYRPTVLIYDAYALSKWQERLGPGARARPRGIWRRFRAAVRRRRS